MGLGAGEEGPEGLAVMGLEGFSPGGCWSERETRSVAKGAGLWAAEVTLGLTPSVPSLSFSW